MRNLFFFDSMLTPSLIVVIYWLGLVGVVISGLGMIFSAYGSLLSGIATLVGGAIGVRIWCELLIVVFKINENLQKLANDK